MAKACSDPQCKMGASTTGRVAALNKRIFNLGLATLDFATLSDATGLSAINMFGIKPPRARFGAGSPFTILPFSPSKWSQLKADDWTARVAYISSPAAVQTVYQTKPVPHTDRNGRPLSEFDADRSFLPLVLYDPQVSKALPFCLYLLCLALNPCLSVARSCPVPTQPVPTWQRGKSVSPMGSTPPCSALPISRPCCKC
eukprot:SAG22_NODE_60_length_23423_cov_8.445250_1_plen_199_part_00